MNERIKQLAKQAAVVYKNIPPANTHTTPLYLIDNFEKNARPVGIEIISDGFCEKFAELIVRECADIFEGVYTDQQRPERIDTRIKQHFGVES